MSAVPEVEKKEVYLEADREIPGQHYVCLSFISPNKVLKNKEIYLLREFLKDYEIQYKVKATESFIMKQVNALQDVAASVQDTLENLTANAGAADLSGALQKIKDLRASTTSNAVAALEEHVKAEKKDFSEGKLLDAYETFVFKNKKKLEDDFFAQNEFRTTVQGLKVRGVYDTYNEAVGRAKTLQKLDPSFNVYVGQVGFWLPWDPDPMDVADQEYADDQLNTLMKKYKENESQRDEFYAKTKQERSKISGMEQKSKFGSGGPASDSPSKDMFGAEDLALARKRENAKNTIENQ